MSLKTLQLTTLTLLSILTTLIGILTIYLATNNTSEVLTGVGIALLEMGLLGTLYEHVIKRLEKDKEGEEEQKEKMEGRSCITEELSMYFYLDTENKTLEVHEKERLKFIANKQFSPLIYLDALHINSHYVGDKPRIEAYLETPRRHTLISSKNIEQNCHIHANAYTCKNPTSINISKNQEAYLTTIRRYRINELTKNENTIIFNRQIWRPTKRIEITIPIELHQKYTTNITIVDYNGDLVDSRINRIEESDQIRYIVEPPKNLRKRFFIMDKIVVEINRRT